MLRTILLAGKSQRAPAELDELVRRVAILYGARLIITDVRNPEDVAEKEIRAFEAIPEGPLQHGAESGPQVVHAILVGEFIPVVCDKGHEADVLVVWEGNLAGADGRPVPEDLAALVRQAPRPLWLARQPIRVPEHILVAYDGSSHSGRALHLAANLAETLGARLTVLNVDESRDEVAQELVLSRAAGYCMAYRISMERVGIFGSAASAIQSYAETHGCDLLIVGAAGVGYLRGLLFGSVAGQLLTNAPCSVMVAK